MGTTPGSASVMSASFPVPEAPDAIPADAPTAKLPANVTCKFRVREFTAA